MENKYPKGEAYQIPGKYKPVKLPGFPEDMLNKEFYANIDQDVATLPSVEGYNFIVLRNLTTIISSPTELVLANPQGSFHFTKMKETPDSKKTS